MARRARRLRRWRRANPPLAARSSDSRSGTRKRAAATRPRSRIAETSSPTAARAAIAASGQTRATIGSFLFRQINRRYDEVPERDDAVVALEHDRAGGFFLGGDLSAGRLDDGGVVLNGHAVEFH